MHMTLSGVLEITAPREFVWTHLMDHEFVAHLSPGIEAVTPCGDGRYAVLVSLGSAPVHVRVKLDVSLENLAPPRHGEMTIRGEAPGSHVDVQTSVHLQALEGTATRLRWEANSQITGGLASIGAWLFRGRVERLTSGFWRTFAHTVSDRSLAGSIPA